ncbi:MAG: GNAT family N-acetyltransferase [Sedimentisphaerales bacterium]|nr:GNAT family N-acetyltransferase [Sedimentisphaerales bacterium]
MNIRVLDEQAVTPEMDEAIRNTLTVCFPHNQDLFSKTRQWRGNIPLFSVVACDGNCIAAHVAVVDRTIRVGNVLLQVAGVGNVCARPEYRKTGLIDQVLALTVDEARQRKFPVGLLFCRDYVRAVYERNGWKILPNQPCTRVEGNREIPVGPDNPRFWIHLNQDLFPTGPIHLLGDKW